MRTIVANPVVVCPESGYSPCVFFEGAYNLMKRRDFLTSVGAAGAALSLPSLLAACGGSTTPASSTGPVTINWWHISTADPLKTDFQNFANQYMAAHKNVKIKISIIDNTDFKTKLQATLQANNPPDIFQSWGGGVLFQYAQAGQVQDITSALQGTAWGNSFSSSALNVYAQNGKSYGVPWDMGAVGFWYNPALFTRAGISTPPTTWDDFLTTIQKLKAAGITPIAIGEKDLWPGHFWYAYLCTRLGGKAAFEKAYNRTGSFADPSFVQAGQMLQDLTKLQPFENGFLGADYNSHQVLMGNGKAAMELMGQWAPANDAAAAADKKGVPLSFFPFPQITGAADNNGVFGGGNGFAIGKNAPPEAIDFVRFVTNATNESLMGQQGAAVPPVTAATASLSTQLQPVVAQIKQADYYQLYYDQYLPQTLANTILAQIQALFAFTATPLAAAQAIEASAATALQPS
jgi:raffinose/stachyose/melibiose transport system substrate-binding protein